MEINHLEQIKNLFLMARADSEYAKMGAELKQLEREFSKLTSRMTQEEQDIAWGFICVSEAMNWRMLELLCEKSDVFWKSQDNEK